MLESFRLPNPSERFAEHCMYQLNKPQRELTLVGDQVSEILDEAGVKKRDALLCGHQPILSREVPRAFEVAGWSAGENSFRCARHAALQAVAAGFAEKPSSIPSYPSVAAVQPA